MSAPVRTVTRTETARRVSQRLSGHNIGALVVVEADGPVAPVGVVTESDIVALVASGRDPETTTVEEFMTEPVVTVAPDATVQEAAELMETNGIRRLPVVEEGLVGIVTAADLTHYIPRIRGRIVHESVTHD